MASYIGRRKFLATLGGVAAWPLAARAAGGESTRGCSTANAPLTLRWSGASPMEWLLTYKTPPRRQLSH
jgi:hypothetical protein